MELAPMRYKDYTWPHNPRVYTIEYKREMGVHKVPFGRYHLQDLGPTRRLMRGEGEFYGPDAYEEFKKLATVFYRSGPGVLIHPVWQAANVYFTELSLAQEPRRDYVKYTFTFMEDYDGYKGELTVVEQEGEAGSAAPSGEVWHTVAQGESLWRIAAVYGVGVEDVIALNPQLKNPNLIYVGEKVRVK